MAASGKMKEDSSRALMTLLVGLLDACRQGETDVAESLGLDMNTIRCLDKLKADQIATVSRHYLRDLCAVEIFNIDRGKLSKSIDNAVKKNRTHELIDQYLSLGACKSMMRSLFGLRSTQISARKRFLDVSTVKGRPTINSHEVELRIYNSWLRGIEITDVRERYLAVAKDTGVSLAKIYRFVLELEVINNNQSATIIGEGRWTQKHTSNNR